MSPIQHITTSKRVLVTAAAENSAPLLNFVKDFTGSVPNSTSPDGSVSGLMHNWDLVTKYYSTKITVWMDEIENPVEWAQDFLSEDALCVIEALGAWIYCFRKPSTVAEYESVQHSLRQFSALAEKIEDGCCLAVALPAHMAPSLSVDQTEWEDLCLETGFEYIDSEVTGKNEFGEQTGMARVREALESNDWLDADADEDSDAMMDDSDGDNSHKKSGSVLDKLLGENQNLFIDSGLEFGEALKSLQQTDGQEGDDDDDEEQKRQVDELDRMIKKVLALKDANGGSTDFSQEDMAELKAAMEKIVYPGQGN